MEEENIIIDSHSENKNIILYEIDEENLKITSREKIISHDVLYFATLLKFYTKFTSLENNDKFDEFSWAESLEIPYSAKTGSVYLEFFNKAETQIQLSIYEENTDKFVLRKILIPNSANFLFVFPSYEGKYILKFKAFVKYNQWSKIKMKQLTDKCFFLVGNLFLPSKKELTVTIFPEKDDLLHWKIPSNLQIHSKLQKDNDSVDLINSGMIYTEHKEYTFCFKNNAAGNASFNVWFGFTKLDD